MRRTPSEWATDGWLEHQTHKWTPLLGSIRCSFLESASFGARTTEFTFPHDALKPPPGHPRRVGGGQEKALPMGALKGLARGGKKWSQLSY